MMSDGLRARWGMVLTGTVGGLVLWLLGKLADRATLPDHLMVALIAASVGFFTALLGLIGPVRPGHALKGAALVGLGLGLLALLVGFRFDNAWDFGQSGVHIVPLLVVLLVPLPFLIAAAGPGGWRDYPALFEESWSAAIRGTLGWVFAGILWSVIALSDALLGIVGIHLLGDWMYRGVVPFVITGAGLGLGLSVVGEVQHLIPSRLVVRLLRLLTPVVLVVAAVFVLGVVVQGMDGLFRGFSAAAVVLVVAAGAVTLVTLVVDMDEAQAPESRVLRQSARGLAGLVAVLAGLAAWAVAARVGQYGWTPVRLLAAAVAGLALCYGLAYLAAVLRGVGWMARIRRANLWLALGGLGLAVLWLTPAFDAERISSASQKARVLAAAPMPDPAVGGQMLGWGRAGEAAVEALKVVAETQGRADIAAWLGGQWDNGEIRPEMLTELRAAVTAVLPVRPASATGTRDVMLSLMAGYELQEIVDACNQTMAGGAAGCVMVVADLMPAVPGEEAVLGLARGDWATLDALIPADGYLQRSPLRKVTGQASAVEMRRLIAEWQTAAPPLTPVMLNQLGAGPEGLFAAP